MDSSERIDIPAADQRAQSWAWASTLIGAVLVIAAPPTLLFNLIYWLENGMQRHTARELEYARLGSVTVLAAIGVASLAGLMFGFRAMILAVTHHQPRGLPCAGILLSLLSLIIWLVVGVDLLLILHVIRG